MSDIKVLVVDDSRIMRTLITNALEDIRGITVVGDADCAEDARRQIPTLMPDVITLDVEMPGMSGIAFLEEIMTTRPLPVIMFSTRTTSGAGDADEAQRLGAIGCFPKPVGPPDMMKKVLDEVAACIKNASQMKLEKLGSQDKTTALAPVDWNGCVLVVSADAGSLDTLTTLLARFPEYCPPTLVALPQVDAATVDRTIAHLSQTGSADFTTARDGLTIEPGKVYFAPGADRHLVLGSWPDGTCHLLDRDPVSGARPSASLMFASAAKAAGEKAVGLVLTRDGDDAARAASVLKDARGRVMRPAADGAYELARAQASQPVKADDLAVELIALFRK